MTLKERLLDYLNNLYIPVSKKEQVERLKAFIDSVSLRMPNSRDAFKTHFTILTIRTKGKGNRRSFDTYGIQYVDFNSIGTKYALAYLYDENGEGKPIRMDITSIKNILII